jgi:hypothetical protein
MHGAEIAHVGRAKLFRGKSRVVEAGAPDVLRCEQRALKTGDVDSREIRVHDIGQREAFAAGASDVGQGQSIHRLFPGDVCRRNQFRDVVHFDVLWSPAKNCARHGVSALEDALGQFIVNLLHVASKPAYLLKKKLL